MNAIFKWFLGNNTKTILKIYTLSNPAWCVILFVPLEGKNYEIFKSETDWIEVVYEKECVKLFGDSSKLPKLIEILIDLVEKYDIVAFKSGHLQRLVSIIYLKLFKPIKFQEIRFQKEIEWITKWYSEYCDGDWEHENMVDIILTSKGKDFCWKLKIDFANLESLNDYETYRKNNFDWFCYSFENKIYNAQGDLSKLSFLIDIFRERS